MKKIAYLCSASLAFLTACAPPKAPSAVEMETTKVQVAPSTEKSNTITSTTEKTTTTTSSAVPTSFTLSGAIAAKSHQKGWTAMVDWKQSGPHAYQITLLGPLGSQAVRIEEHQGVITYREGARKLSSGNGDDLLAKKTGIHLPVNSLYYWVRGVPAPGGVQTATRDAEGHLKVLKQGGYTIEYNEYMPVGQYVMPRKIRLAGKDVVVKLVIKHWSF